MENKVNLITVMDRVFNKYLRLENQKKFYGTDVLLSKAEIHTLVAVGDNPDINITKLAEFLGITKGAASQMIYKLIDKKLICKKVSPSSDSEVVLQLTSDGKKNYFAHSDYHEQTNDEALLLIESMPDDFYENLIKFLVDFEKVLDDKLNPKI